MGDRGPRCVPRPARLRPALRCAARADGPPPPPRLPRSAPPPALLTLARDNLAAEIRAAVAAGADVNAGNAIGQRAVHIAALHGNIEALAALLDCGAEPSAPNERDMTPLVRAARRCGPARGVRAVLTGPRAAARALRCAALRGEREAKRHGGV
jgi:ankyrin repeat protein